MSEKEIKTTRKIEYDRRSFVEIWHTLPPAGQKMIADELIKRKITKQGFYNWTNGETITPRPPQIKKLRETLKKLFGINTLPYTLFPGKEATEYILAKYGPKRWDGKVDWPSIKKVNNADEEDEQEDF